MPCPTGPCGGFTCGRNSQCRAQKCECLPGYQRPCTDRATGVVTCADIDECRTGGHRCPRSQSRCENTPGGYRCVGFCRPGYGNVGTGLLGTPIVCRDINECTSRSSRQSCGISGRCENTIGSFRCTCLPGYTGNGRECRDIDECNLQNRCHIQATCVNIPGSYNCTCNEGYQGDGRTCVRSRIEEDVNECIEGGVCHRDATCVNTRGSYLCWCRNGFTGNGVDTCEDIDECRTSSTCHQNATCTNTIGSYQCACPPGFSGDGVRRCEEVNSDCDTVNVCHGDALCVRTGDGTTCLCAEGYTGDGVHDCTDIDECDILGVSACGANSICTNNNGSFNCTCVGDSCSGVNIGSTEVSFNDRTLEYLGIGFGILLSLLAAVLLGWLIRRKRRRRPPSFEDENPADQPHVDTQGVTIEPVQPEVSVPVNSTVDPLTPHDVTQTEDAPTSSGFGPPNLGTELSENRMGGNLGTPQPSAATHSSLEGGVVPGNATTDVLGNARSDAGPVGTDVEPSRTTDHGVPPNIGPHFGNQAGTVHGPGANGTSAGAASNSQAISPSNSALDTSLPAIDEIDIWQGPPP